MRPPELSGGTVNAALANELGRLVADFAGRGAQRSRAFLHQDVVICVLEDGATNAEKNLVAAGKAGLVRVQRDALRHAIAPHLIPAVERLTTRTVRTFLSGPGVGAGEIAEPELMNRNESRGPRASLSTRSDELLEIYGLTASDRHRMARGRQGYA